MLGSGFGLLRGITNDVVGNIYLSDCTTNVIRKCNSAGVSCTVLAGSGTQGIFSGLTLSILSIFMGIEALLLLVIFYYSFPFS